MTIGMASNRLTDNVLYRLEKLYKQWIKIYKLISVSNDPVLGTSTPVTRTYDVQAIVLPATNVRKHLYSAGYMSVARNFTYGGLFDEIAIPIIFKKRQLPEFTTNDYALINGQRIDFKRVEETMDGKSFHILGQQSPAVGV